MSKKLSISGSPEHFSGRVRLPPSKSYVHRALFVAALGEGTSTLTGCGKELADDLLATIGVLREFGARIRHTSASDGTIEVIPGKARSKKIHVFAQGSGTTARFAISFAALMSEGTSVKISGDDSLTMRPMQSIFDSLGELGVRCAYEKEPGRLPIIVNGGGIEGGECSVDGSISSQFVSSLLISCTRAESDTLIRIKDAAHLVSKPYIDATIAVLSYFGLKVDQSQKYSSFKIGGNQVAKQRRFAVPGDMSAGAALIGATLAARGSVELLGVNPKFPQADAEMTSVARKFGALIIKKGNSIKVTSQDTKQRALTLDLNESPDIVPIVAGLAAALGTSVTIQNIGHLRFKESDRISVLSRELGNLGVGTREGKSTLTVLASNQEPHFRKPILIDPERDHRMLMALAIAGLSGRYGEILISNPECVKKSYPDFVRDIQKLCGDRKVAKIVEVSR
jgi:3-phosphoshikimate 1-carboxyvinyltransferase